MARILLEPMEIGNQMFAVVDGRGDEPPKMYVGSQKEWVEILPQSDGTRKYITEKDESTTRELYLAYVAKSVEVGMDRYVEKHLKQREARK